MYRALVPKISITQLALEYTVEPNSINQMGSIHFTHGDKKIIYKVDFLYFEQNKIKFVEFFFISTKIMIIFLYFMVIQRGDPGELHDHYAIL